MAKAAAAVRAATQDLSIKVTLAGIRPPIWRRLAMAPSTTLEDLHHAIQAVMGWDGDHLHCFEVAGQTYGDPTQFEECEDADELHLGELAKAGMSRFTYTYDFGDNWVHNILIEKAAPKTLNPARPCCVAGARCCPPEDCGGIVGYENLLEARADPTSPEAAELLAWAGDDFDPEAFSVEDANERLADRFKGEN